MVSLLSFLVAGAQTSRSASTDLSPDWDVTFGQGIEWCAPADAETAAPGDPSLTLRALLVVCTKDARIDLIDLQTGRSRLREPIPVQPGTRFAGSQGGVAYGYGVSRVYAFRIAGPELKSTNAPGLLWQTAAAPRSQPVGDPEFMTRLVAAKATPASVLIVRSDGRVAELNREDGSVRWKHKLREITNCTLHVRDESAALMWKAGDAFHIAFLDLTRDRPRPTVRTIEDTLPIWSALTDDSLVVVWPSRFAVISRTGDLRVHEMRTQAFRATAAAVALYAPKQPVFNQPAVGRPTMPASLLLQHPDGFLLAYELATGKLRLGDEHSRWRAVRPGAGSSLSLQVRGDLALGRSGGSISIWQLPSGLVLASYTSDAMAVGAGEHDGFAYGLISQRPSSRDLRAMEDIDSIGIERGRSVLQDRFPRIEPPWPLFLVRQIMVGAPWPRPDEPVDPGSREYRLGEAGLIHETFWLGGKLVIVEDKRVRVYTLP